MNSNSTTKTTPLDYASVRRRRRLAEVDVGLWAVVGLVVALLLLDLACIMLILLRH